MESRFHIPGYRAARRLAVARLRDEQGFTLPEVLVAVIILVVGLLATVGVFTSSKSMTLVSQRHEVAVHQAQREIEKLRSLKYSQLGLDTTVAPSPSSDPKHPNNRIQGDGKLRVRAVPCDPGVTPCPLDEEFVLEDPNEPSFDYSVNPGPESFSVGEGGNSAVTGKIYRYVTWRDESCPTGLCDGSRNTKRLLVAVTIDPVRNLGPTKPIWVASIITDPNEGATGGSQQGPAPPSSSVQNFYLYDKRCSGSDTKNNYSAPTTSHETHNTASNLAICADSGDLDGDGDEDANDQALDTRSKPDLMGPVAPSYPDPPLPPYRYSADLSGDYPAGLAMLHAGTGCPASSYPVGSDLEGKPGKWSLHAWATKEFTQEFALSGGAFVSLWTTSVGSVPGAGRFCVTLVDRLTAGGVPNDVVLGSMSREYSPWPTTKNEPGRSCGSPDFPCGRQLSFRFDLTASLIRPGARLMLFLSALETSAKDLVFLYDDPRYRSFLEVETATPCNTTGDPCSNS
jgi:prepilin-type N-terminal cleavage/methylation domain-containing protein